MVLNKSQLSNIAQWDGKAVAAMQLLADQHHGQQGYVQQLVTLLHDDKCQLGASWLLKASLDTGEALPQSQIEPVLMCLLTAASWQTKLHILQILPFLTLNSQQASKIYPALRAGLSDPNKFVRAWSYNGMYELSRQHEKYILETKQYFELALKDEAPSVKARIRNIMKSELFD